MQTRLTTLETKWDTVIPTLATREDLMALEGRLRDNMLDGFNDVQRWLVTTTQRWVIIMLCLAAIAAGSGAGLVLKRGVMVPVSSASHAAAEPLPEAATVVPAEERPLASPSDLSGLSGDTGFSGDTALAGNAGESADNPGDEHV
ncbi:hypothetical protein OU995_22010 [Roseateles sp. SL47]|uniref:hypothetical protein n=1 Tax=Roseateles sp. SL47 TaxID=2995138 RepID=UPI00226F88F8|nr:hypothetical protein [Roseateles sp. SL47]WAC72210.1 hypothetical protein OU995_22010 [Roseateles sp. SL47]